MNTFKIYFSDLNEDAKERLLKAVGANDASEMNWDMDICPIAIYDFENVPEEPQEIFEQRGLFGLNKTLSDIHIELRLMRKSLANYQKSMLKRRY